MRPSFDQKYHTISQAANLLGVSKSTLRRWEQSKKIRSIIDESGIHLYASDAIAKLAEQTGNPVKISGEKHQSKGSSSLLPVSDAARLAGVSKATLRRWESAGILTSKRTPGGARRYRSEDIKTLLTSRTIYQRMPQVTNNIISKDIKDNHNIPSDAQTSSEISTNSSKERVSQDSESELSIGHVPFQAVAGDTVAESAVGVSAPVLTQNFTTPIHDHPVSRASSGLLDETALTMPLYKRLLTHPYALVGLVILILLSSTILFSQIAGIRSGAQRDMPSQAALIPQ
ncbi:MerR family DNA-binding transcriptional regulator, partial [Candidatus Gottesmanbacteria bacterium]|nr:MerR family DNA-binding transcriptional regulator [Candidatus Gottesmanbacteria bacterium]